MLVSLSVSAVTVNEVAGSFKGNLNIAGSQYPNKEVFILPGVESNTITFVLPDFRYNNAPLGDIVLVNMPMDGSGRLTLDEATLFIKAISERAQIAVLNDFKDGSEVYNSVLTASHAQVLLSIAASTLPEPILVLFTGDKVTNENYAVVNGRFRRQLVERRAGRLALVQHGDRQLCVFCAEHRAVHTSDGDSSGFSRLEQREDTDQDCGGQQRQW